MAIRFLVKYILHLQNRSFVSDFKALFPEAKLLFRNWSFVSNLFKKFKFEVSFPACYHNSYSKLCFQNRSFFSRLLFQFKFETSFPEYGLRFRDWSIFSRLEASFLTLKQLKFEVLFPSFQLPITTQAWSFVSKIGASFLKLKLCFRNRSFFSRIKAFFSGVEASIQN